MQRSAATVGAALVALLAGCGARTGLEWSVSGTDAGVAIDAGADAAPDGPCACPAGQTCIDGGCGAPAPTGVVVLGWNGTTAPDFLAFTWGWDGTSWTEKDVVSPQPPRVNACMARLNDSSVLFGGIDSAPATMGVLGETWVWNGTWTDRSGPGPSARSSAAMATLGNSVVLFGGLDAADNVHGDTWTWDGASWTQVDTPGPAARTGHAMGTLGDQVVLFGGKTGDIAVTSDGSFFGDTWTFDGKRWTQVAVQGPSPRVSAAMATLDGTLVLFGGIDGTGTTLGDTWTWDGTTWTQRQVPGPITGLGFFPMPNLAATLHDTVVLFAAAQGGDSDATWTWDGESWTRLAADGPNLLEGPHQLAAMSAW